MITRRAVTGLFAAGVAGGAQAVQAQMPVGALPPAAPAAPPPKSRREEAAALRAFAEKTHPRGREAAADERWRQGWADINGRIDSMTQPAFIMALKAMLAWFEDGHTTIYISGITAPGFDLRLPIQVKPFFDGLYVTGAKDEGAPLLGARITRVEGVPVDEFVRRFAKGWPGNNAAWAHHDAGLAFLPAVMRGSGLVPEAALTAPVLVEGDIGAAHFRARLIPSVAAKDNRTALTRTQTAVETWRPGSQPNFIHKEGLALVIAFDSLSEDLDSTIAFVRQAIAAMEDPSLDRVIIDLRRNGGGNNFFGEPLRKYIERSRFNRPDGLYVLIGPQTFSAAQNLANRLERETYAVFVGEPTGGEPNHYGDAALYTGNDFRAGVSTIPWFDSYPADRRRWIMPDLLIPATFADWVAGKDSAMDAALTHRTGAKPDELTRERTFFYERDSQKVEWKPFWRT